MKHIPHRISFPKGKRGFVEAIIGRYIQWSHRGIFIYRSKPGIKRGEIYIKTCNFSVRLQSNWSNFLFHNPEKQMKHPSTQTKLLGK